DVKSPTALTVMRRDRPSGAVEREKGCASDQKPGARNLQMKNCPAEAFNQFRCRPEIRTDTTPWPSSRTSATRIRCQRARKMGWHNRKRITNCNVPTYSAVQNAVAKGLLIKSELVGI